MKTSKTKKARILVFGTFDILHPGHFNFFRQAKALAKHSVLVVSVARDKNVRKIKGFLPKNSERRRLANIKQINLVSKAVLSAADNYLGHIVRLKPDIIALGYDQRAYTQNLRVDLAKLGCKIIIRRLKPYYPSRYKSSLMRL